MDDLTFTMCALGAYLIGNVAIFALAIWNTRK